MDMTYERAVELYNGVRRELDQIDNDAKARKAPLMEKINVLESWITAKAAEDGLENVKTRTGTVYWTTHSSATVASRHELFEFCKSNDAWDLVESRVSSSAVSAHIAAHGAPPPGVNFSTRRVFKLRTTTDKEVK